MRRMRPTLRTWSRLLCLSCLLDRTLVPPSSPANWSLWLSRRSVAWVAQRIRLQRFWNAADLCFKRDVGERQQHVQLHSRNATLGLTGATRIVVQPLTSALPSGVYNADLTLQFSDGTLRRVGLRTIVMPAPASSSATPGAELDHATASCTPTQLIPPSPHLANPSEFPPHGPFRSKRKSPTIAEIH